jgi:hypothetical protein
VNRHKRRLPPVGDKDVKLTAWFSQRVFRNPARYLAGVGVLSLVGWSALLSSAQIPEFYKPKEEELPAAVAPQPISFSHRQHAETALACRDCHAGATEKERAGLPQTDTCMLCHQTIANASAAIQRLANVHAEGAKVEWVRVYQVPDLVFFSHASHVGAGIDCSTCHGPVGQRDVLAKEVSTGMVRCMNCHAASDVSNDCVFCHQLGH